MKNFFYGQCYAISLRAAGSAASNLYNKTLEPAGINVTQYRLIKNLQSLGQANVTHWAEKVGIDRSTMIRNIKVLEASGWVGSAEGHGKQYRLTEAGKNVYIKALPLWEAAQKQVSKLLGEEDIAAIFRIRDKLQSAAGML